MNSPCKYISEVNFFMRKKIFLMLGLFLLATLAFKGKTYAYTDSNVVYTVSYANERYKEGNKWVETTTQYLDGYLLFERLSIADYTELVVNYTTSESDIIILLTDIKRSENSYFLPSLLISSEEVFENPNGGIYLEDNSHYYLYFGKKIKDTVPKNSTKTYTTTFSEIYVGGNGEAFDFSLETVCSSITVKDELVNIWDTNKYFNIVKNDDDHDYSVNIIQNNYTQNYTTPGVYEVIYRVSSGDVYHDFSLFITVKGSYVPTISTSDSINVVVDISSPITLASLKADIKAYDEEDGDLTSKLVFDTNYDELNLDIGQYYLNAYVVDSDNNESNISIKIHVVDVEAPKIDNSIFTLSYAKEYSDDELFRLLGASDNYDNDIKYEIIENTYKYNFSKIGSYAVVFRLTDSSNNYATYPITIKVVDDIAPVIVKSDISATTAKCLSKDEILKYVSINDLSKYSVDVDFDNYKNNYNKVGNYIITISATDVYTNKTSICLNINVISNTAPIVYYDNKIRIYTDTTMTKESLIAFLKEATNVDMSFVSKVESSYFDTPDKEGDYTVTLTSIDTFGDESKSVFNIVVSKRTEDTNESNEGNTNTSKKKGFFAKIGSFFKKIGRWFKKLFS